MPGRIGTVGFVAPGLRLVCHREARLAGLMSLRLQIALFDGFDEIDVFGPYEMLSIPGIELELATV